MMTHTLATMNVSTAAFDEIKEILVAAGYDCAILERDDLIIGEKVEMIDMTGIGLCRVDANTRPPHSSFEGN